MLTNSDRGNEPRSWRHASMVPHVQFTWHHTIPWNCLAAIWNGLVAGEHWEAVTSFLHLVSAPDPAGTVRQMRAGNLEHRDELHTRLTWQGWNIVEGPGNDFRQGDPGEQFDRWSKFSGISGNQRATLQAVDRLYVVMSEVQETLRDAAAISKNDARRLNDEFRTLAKTLRDRAPVAWNEQMWTRVRDGTVSRKHPAVWAVAPKWKKV